MRTPDCACGRVKELKATRCRTCHEAQRGESARMVHKRVPKRCACGRRGPSPWHCACGRWKTSTESACDLCTLGRQLAA